MINIDEKLYVIDENGKELAMQILFTFDNEEFGKSYVLFFDPNDPDNIYASSYDDEGNLNLVEDQDEWDMVNEVLEAFQDEKTYN